MKSSGIQSWSKQPIGALLQESRISGSNGATARKITVKLYGKGVIAKQNENGSVATQYYVRRAGQFIYSKLDFLNGAFGIVPAELDKFESTADLPAFDFRPGVEPDWFLALVSRPAFYGEFKGSGMGSRKAVRIGVEDFLGMKVGVPPLPEQRAIARVLGEVDTNLLQSEATVRHLKALRQVTLSAGIAKFARKSAVCLLGDLAIIQHGVAKNSKASTELMRRHAYLRVANVLDGGFSLDRIAELQVSDADASRATLRPGDVLFTEGGDEDKLGRGAVWQGQVPDCLHQNHVFAVRPDKTRLLPDFLHYYRSSQPGIAYFRACAKRTTNLASINSSQLKQFPIPVLKLEDQSTIAKLGQSLDHHLTTSTAHLTALRTFRRHLADALLSGRPRIPAHLWPAGPTGAADVA